jgi:HSP20 family protein
MSLIKLNRNDFFPTIETEWGNFFNNDIWDTQLGKSIPAVNLKESDQNYHVEVAAPGLKKDALKIEVDHHVLTISSETKKESEQKEGNKVMRREFSYSAFSRSFTLPDNADDKNISAAYTDGIIKIDIPKKQASAPTGKKTIEIK